MEKKYNSYTKSITLKLTVAFIIGLVVAVLGFGAIYHVSKLFLDDYFLKSNYIYDSERKDIKSFQAYVLDNDISATDSLSIRKWETKNKITALTISRERILLYDNSYMSDIPLIETDSLQLHTMFIYFHTVTFSDGDADVFIYKNYAKRHYDLLIVFSVALSIITGMGIFVILIRKEGKYIVLLRKEVSLMHEGALSDGFSLQGNDEVTELARTLNQMRTSLIEKEAYEKELKAEEEKLVLGMAHDLRTPLTGLMGYLELCKRDKNMDNLDRAIGKVLQVRDLSDKLFEYFLSSEGKKCNVEPPLSVSSAIGDYLSELSVQLSATGFNVVINDLEWKDVYVQVNFNNLGRIINNISSNINKYAAPGSDVFLSSKYEDGMVYFMISNEIGPQQTGIQGTKIGLKNVASMMTQMGGSAIYDIKAGWFFLTLAFPYKNEAPS